MIALIVNKIVFWFIVKAKSEMKYIFGAYINAAAAIGTVGGCDYRAYALVFAF